MNRCESYQAQLLDHLYGLLEPAEADELRRHLETCDACRSALMNAERQQRQLASAAKLPFPEVHFEAPRELDVIGGGETFSPFSSSGFRWAMAASILLLLGGLTISGGLYSWQEHQVAAVEQRLYDLKGQSEKLNESVARADQDFEKARNEFQRLNNDYPARLAKLQTAASDPKQLRVVLNGPKTPEAGAVNHYQLQTFAGYQPVAAQVAVRVVDEKKQVVYRQEGEAVGGNFEVVLPPTLPLKANNALALEISARGRDGGLASIEEHFNLTAPRYVTHLATDKPLYQPGETIRYRSLTLEAFGLRPVQEDLQLIFALKPPQGAEIVLSQGIAQAAGPAGLISLGPDQRLVRGIGTGEYLLDRSAPGGEYTLEVREADGRFPPQQRKILVNRYQPPQLNKEADFTRRSYGPGDTVTVTCKAKRGDQPAAGIKVIGSLTVDNQSLNALSQDAQTDATGTVDLRFKLPDQIERGDASATMQFSDGGNVETLVRPVPIVLKKLQVEFFPEGGELLAGVPNRVYFRARTMLGKPAELQGQIVDEQNAVVAEIRTFHDATQPAANHGLGVLTFTPQADRKYQLRVQEPVGIESIVGPMGLKGDLLPSAKADGVALSVPTGVFQPQDALRAKLQNTGKERTLVVGAYCRGKLLDSQRLGVKAGQAADVELKPDAEVGGVYRVTVFEEIAGDGQPRFVPLAERLVYRTPATRLNLNVNADKRSYVPGDKVKLTVEARNEKAEAAPAILMVAVADQSVLKLADDKTERLLPTQFLLASEVSRPEELEYADFLLGPQASAATALDLLLGTQGWRKFADPNKPAPGDSPVLAQTIDFSERRLEELRKEFDRGFAAASDRLVKAEEKLNAVRQDKEAEAQRQQLAGAVLALTGDYRAAVDRLNRIQDFGRTLRGALLPMVLVTLVIGLVVCSVRRVELPRALPYLVTAACTVTLFGFVTSYELGAGLPDSVGKPFELAKAGVAGTRVADAKKIIEEETRRRQAAVAPRFPAPRGMMAGRGQPMVKALMPMNADFGRRQAAKQFGGMAAGLIPQPLERLAKGEAKAEPPLPGPFIVREYAHIHTLGENQARSDFAETLYWHPVLVLPDGKAEAAFDLCDSVTTFQVLAAGHTLDGRLGATTTTIESRLPLTVETKLPKEVTAGDVLDIPVAVANNADAASQVRLDVQAQGLNLVKAPSSNEVTLSGGQRDRRVYRFQPAVTQGEARVTFSGQAGNGSDRVERSLRVVPQGFPVVGAFSDVLEKSATTAIVLPEGVLPGSLTCRVTAYPSTLADLQQGLESLLREPHGCFEQTSSSNYPNLLILDYLKQAHQDKPEVARRAQELLKSGYAKLTSFECLDSEKNAKQGYEWFGGTAAPHEALTAYGLMQFRDLARVQDVDPAMVERTYRYLLSRKDGKGGFQRNPRALDSFGRAPQHITDAYIIWSLSEDPNHRDAKDFAAELDAVVAKAKPSKDPYFLALVANGLFNCNRTGEGVALLSRLSEAQQQDGHLDAAETSITGSQGRDLQIETTALSLLAWLKAQRPDQFNVNVQRAAKWIGQQRGGQGGFGATQSTILALKALIAYAQANKRPPEAGDLIVYVGSKEVARRHFDAQVTDALVVELPNADKLLQKGKNELRVEVTGKNVFPFSVGWSYRTLQPLSADKCAVRLQTRLDRTQVNEGESVRLHATLENVSGQGQGMAVAILGLPAGLDVPEDMKHLKDLAKSGDISAFEIQGRELVLYWRDLAPTKKIDVSLDLICRVPGEYQGPASRGYLYYNADHKHWVEPLKVAIAAK